MRSNGIKSAIIIIMIIGVFILAITIFFYRLNRDPAIPEKSESEIEEELNQMVIMHLENKYGEQFIIEKPRYGSSWHTTTQGSPIPGGSVGGKSGFPRYCYAFADSDMDFRFRVYVYRESLEKSLDINNVKEIQDGYCWKFIKEKMKDEIQEKLWDILDNNYKLFIRTDGDDFNSQLTANSTAEDYLKLAKSCPYIQIFIFVKASDDKSEKNVKKYASQLITDFKKIKNEFEISFDYYIVNSNDDFDSIDIVKEENGHFAGHDKNGKTWQNPIWDLKMEKRFGIEINTRTGKETIYNFSDDDLENYKSNLGN